MPDLSGLTGDIVVDRERRIVAVIIRDDQEATEIAEAFGPNDTFRVDLLAAAQEARLS